MKNQRPICPFVGSELLGRVEVGRAHRAPHLGLGALLALLALFLSSGCGERVLGWPSRDTVSPTVTATSPADDATGVPLNVVISATFSEEMDAESLDGESIVVAIGAESVPGTVSYFGRSANFLPTSPLAPDTLYTATVSGLVTDLVGNEMGNNHVWTFTSGVRADLAPVR